MIWFILFYPNIASLPVPTPLSQIHLGLLPTWNWGFQFGVNLDEPNRAPIDMTAVALLAIATIGLCVAAVYAVRAWRSARRSRIPRSALWLRRANRVRDLLAGHGREVGVHVGWQRSVRGNAADDELVVVLDLGGDVLPAVLDDALTS